MVLSTGLLSVDAQAQSLSDIRDRFQNASAEQQERVKKRGGFYKSWKQDVTKSVTKISNGIQVTMTTDNAEILAKLQAREGRESDTRTTTIEVISNGIIVTTTSDDAEIVEKMHNRADKHALKSSINREVTNLDNGVQMTITSDNAEAVAKIQAREQKESKHESINKEVITLSNGVQVTITSDDEAMVERIQKRAERGGKKRKARGFKRFNDRMDRAQNATDGQ